MSINPLSAISPIVSAARLAWSVYRSCKAAPGSFNNISAEVLSLHAVLKEVEETLVGQELSKGRKERLETISGGCKAVLEDLEALLKKYESLGSQSKRTWDRLNWDAGEISELRARLTSNIVLLTAFMSTCQIVVKQKLNQLVQEFQDGKHEGSILSVATIESLAQDEKQTWRAIRKELEDIGISIAAFDANRDFIISWFQQAILTGAFEERGVDSSQLHETIAGKASLTASSRPDFLSSFQADDQGQGSMLDTASTASMAKQRSNSTQEQEILRNDDEHTSQNRQAMPKKTRPRIATLIARLRGYNNAFFEACAVHDWDRDPNGDRLIKAAELLEKRADINALYNGSTLAAQWRKEWQGNNALCMAADQLNTSLVLWLLNHGANAQARNMKGETPLHKVVSGFSDVLSRLLRTDVHIGQERQIRVQRHVGDIIELLISRGAMIDATDGEGLTSLNTCIRTLGSFESVARLFLQHGADCNAKVEGDWTPLMYAAKHGLKGMIHLLLEFGANVHLANMNSESALRLAVQASDIAIVQLLLHHGASPNDSLSDNRPLLQVAFETSNMEVATLLIRAGEHLNRTSSRGLSLLQSAITSPGPGHLEMAKLMLQNGANVKYLDSASKTCLCYAVEALDADTVRFLLDHGADPNDEMEIIRRRPQIFTGPPARKSVLQLAIEKRDFKIAKILIERGANVNFAIEEACGRWGRPVLHHAIENSSHYDREIIDLMLESGADLESKHHSCTALDLAVGSDDMELALYLLNKGAVNNAAFFTSGEYLDANVHRGWIHCERVKQGYEKLSSLLHQRQGAG